MSLINDKNRRREMADKAANLADANSIYKIAKLIIQYKNIK